MLMRRSLPRTSQLITFVLALATLALAQAPPKSDEGFSGMYTFLREGELVQITVEAKGQVTGFVSRYGDSESDQGRFSITFSSPGGSTIIN